MTTEPLSVEAEFAWTEGGRLESGNGVDASIMNNDPGGRAGRSVAG